MSRRRVRSLTVALPALMLSLILPTGASAQDAILTGTVANESGTPVNAAQIEIRGGVAGTGTLTDGQGRFRITLAPGTYDLVVTAVGHQTTPISNVRVSAGATTTLDITMPTQAESLNPITVTVSRSAAGGGERAVENIATTDVITAGEISERPATNMADHLREAPGVDVITHGLQASNVVVRGFNNIFSGALHMLSDYRLAGVPSLRVNLMHFIPTTEEDLERIEVVLGPGSALYGPNTANGVVHMLSKSPLTSQGTTVTLGTGAKALDGPSAFQGSFRSAFLITEDLGFKVSGQYLTGDEWSYVDPTEEEGRLSFVADPAACTADRVVRGLDPAAGAAACERVGVRDFDISRYSVEARADWRFMDEGTFVGTYGQNSSSGIELTGLGAGQVNDWISEFYQGRVTYKRLFAQAYYNTSDAGNSWLLRDGLPLQDNSTLFVAQLQQGVGLADGRQDFTVGADIFRTRPDSKGSIYGSYETSPEGVEIDEWGVYLQSKTKISEKFDLILAGRVDSHSILPDNVFSPRAALVFNPSPDHGIRASYNRAFSTPSALNFFLDISGGVAPGALAQLGYSTRAYGSGRNGWSLQNSDGSLQGMRSPCTPAGLGGPSALVPVSTQLMWGCMVGVMLATGAIDAATAAFLGSLSPTSGDIGAQAWNPLTDEAVAVGSLVLPDQAPTLESNTETFEVGWTGVFNNRISISADAYYMKKNNFVSPLLVQTPLLRLDADDITAYLTPFVGAATAAALGAGGGTIPVGVVSSESSGARGPELILSYRNVGDIDLWGTDFSLQAFLTDEWMLTAMWSHVSDDSFEIGEGAAPITLNAPTDKASFGLGYNNADRGFNASSRVRFTSAFPASSAGFVGEVESAMIVDLTAGYEVPNTAATIQLSMTNVLGNLARPFEDTYQSFIGVPEMGRYTMLRVKYDLF
jgi:iron complex outermembrane receptor protein